MKTLRCLIMGVAMVSATLAANAIPPKGPVFATHWAVTVSHAPPGVHSARALAWANTNIAIALEKLKSNTDPQCFVAPFSVGYHIVLLSNRPLSVEEKDSFWTLIRAKIDEAVENDRRMQQSQKG